MTRPHRLLLVGLAAIFLMLSASASRATDGFASGGDLKLWCDNMHLDDVHWGLCVGSITAAHDIVMTYQNAGVAEGLVCTSMDHTRGDVVFAVQEFLNDNPEYWEYSLGDTVLSALVEKFPCE